MATDESGEKGYPEAHTRRDLGENSPAPDALAAEQLAILDGSPDLLDQDAIAVAAEFVAAPRRGRGRPKGAANKRNDDMMAYLQAIGHRDPAVTLSMIQTANTMGLAKMLGSVAEVDGVPVLDRTGNPVIIPADPLKVLAVQQRAASDLMAYFYAKKPQQLELPEGANQRAVMVIGEFNGNLNMLVDGGFMSAGVAPEQHQQNQALSAPAPCDKNKDVAKDEIDQ